MSSSKPKDLYFHLITFFRKFNYPPPNIDAIALNIRKSFINPVSPLRKPGILKNEAIVDKQMSSSRYKISNQIP